ncbi:MAG TPA: cupin domain-containing protein [Candidatus Sulfotelmatobacter sp.]|jgi:uncharacterized cupin superfamily protein|nr:cupin domain-containing protein [Candidatus Sulfotelmatobacter sp.]
MAEIRSIRFDPAAPLAAVDEATTYVWYTDPGNKLCAGFWASADFHAPVNYTEDEFCTLISGVVRLTDASGHVETYRAGESFLIPSGFTGVWETVEPVKKFFVIHEKNGL